MGSRRASVVGGASAGVVQLANRFACDVGRLSWGGDGGWCYGAPGIVRVLWISGDVLGEDEWKETAVEACRATARRPEEQWGIISPTFCHGYSGVLHLTQVMYEESGLAELASFRNHILKKVIESYDDDLPFGYANLAHTEAGFKQVHSAGLLEGAAGIALVLLSLLSSEQPSWDRVFKIR